MRQPVGVVLTGGEGRRLGLDKAELTIDSRTYAERAARVLWEFCGTVLISVRPGGVNPAPDFPSIEDAPPQGRGPLAGIMAAYENSGDADLLVLACDYPRVGADIYRGLLARADDQDDLVIIADGAGRDHPLVGLWRRQAEPTIRSSVELGLLKVRGVFPDLVVKRVGSMDFPSLDLSDCLINVNRPADLERLRRETPSG
jgi:molybdopterin-guanine dinucleotide biosynthesis protein A